MNEKKEKTSEINREKIKIFCKKNKKHLFYFLKYKNFEIELSKDDFINLFDLKNGFYFLIEKMESL